MIQNENLKRYMMEVIIKLMKYNIIIKIHKIAGKKLFNVEL